MSQGLYLLRSIIDSNARTEFRQVGPHLFLEAEQPAYEFVSSFYRQHGAFPNEQACLDHGFVLPSGGNPVGHYMERCEKRAIFNAISRQHEAFAEAMQRRDVAEAQVILTGMVTEIGSLSSQQDVHTVADLVEEVVRDYEHAHRNPGMQGITTGYAPLDEVTGGLEPGDVFTLAARPGMGKSWLLINSAWRAWSAGHSALFVTMEMTAKQIARRFVGLNIGLNPNMIRQGQISNWKRDIFYNQVTDLRHGNPFHILAGSFDKSVAVVDAAVQEFTPDIIYIDASYLLDPSGAKGQRRSFELLGDVAKEIKQMAMSRNRGVFQTVQFNREATGKKKKLGTEHIGGTDAVGQITSVGMSISPGDSDQTRNIQRRINVFKNREGDDTGEFYTNFLFTPPNFDVIHREADENDPNAEAVDPETLETAGGI